MTAQIGASAYIVPDTEAVADSRRHGWHDRGRHRLPVHRRVQQGPVHDRHRHPMNLITDSLRGLVQRKLWPVALLLVGALVAVPVVLSKPPTTAPASSPNAKQKTEPIPATFVSSADATEATEAAERRRVLGDVKDPFEPAPLKKAKKKKVADRQQGRREDRDQDQGRRAQVLG